MIDEFLNSRSSEAASEVARILISRIKRWDMVSVALLQSAIENLPSRVIRRWQVQAPKHEIARIEQKASLDGPSRAKNEVRERTRRVVTKHGRRPKRASEQRKRYRKLLRHCRETLTTISGKRGRRQ